jgi:hypothetical protein
MNFSPSWRVDDEYVEVVLRYNIDERGSKERTDRSLSEGAPLSREELQLDS